MKKTPPPKTPHTLGYERLESPQDVAAALGVDEKTVRRWCNRGPEEGRCPNLRSDDDSRLWLNTDEVRAWMDCTGISGTPGRPAQTGLERFWTLFEFYPVPPASESGGPEPFVTPFEQDLINGARTLSKAELSDYVRLNVVCRGNIGRDIHSLAGWLANLKGRELQDRLRSIVFSRLEWIVGMVGTMHDEQDGVTRGGVAYEIIEENPQPPAKSGRNERQNELV